MKSLVTHRKTFNLGPFVTNVVRSAHLCEGSIVVDILQGVLTPEVFTFIVWQREVTDDPRCDGCLNHRWKAILPKPNSEPQKDAMSAFLAASNYVITLDVDG